MKYLVTIYMLLLIVGVLDWSLGPVQTKWQISGRSIALTGAFGLIGIATAKVFMFISERIFG